MITTLALHPAAAKVLIGKAVAILPEVQHAFKQGRIIISGGTTNTMVAKALLAVEAKDMEAYTAGIITQRAACVTDRSTRLGPWCIEKGVPVQADWLDFLNEMKAGDIFIKGANAFDDAGMIGIMLGDVNGGTAGKAIGTIKARGITWIAPVGLEKRIPCCIAAERLMQGAVRSSLRLGLRCGYIAVANTKLVTEIESLSILSDAAAVQVAAGGVGGMEGASVLAVKCRDEDHCRAVLQLVKKANQVSPLKVRRQTCANCEDPCFMQGKPTE